MVSMRTIELPSVNFGGSNSEYSTFTRPEARLTLPEVRRRIFEHLISKKDYQYVPRDNAGNPVDIIPKEQNELPLRTMKDSYVTAVIPLGSDHHMQERYVSFLGNVRIGRLMEDMDLFSVWICYRHIFNPKENNKHTSYMVVTVLLDQVDFDPTKPSVDADILMSGHVSWTGKSSLETTVWLEQRVGESWQLLGRGVFLMAARNMRTLGAAVVNGLRLDSEEEKVIFQAGERRKRRRAQMQSDEHVKAPPDLDEVQLLHQKYLHGMGMYSVYLNPEPCSLSDTIWISDTQLSNAIFCHPEDRNMYNQVFGGFIIRHAVELSFCTAYLHSIPDTTRQSPRIRHMSYVGFRKPISVGTLMRMHSQVTYTEGNFLQLTTYAEVYDPLTGQRHLSNVFNFSYHLYRPPRMVAPITYHECMLYVDGRRHYLEMKSRDLQEKHEPTKILVDKMLQSDE